MEDIEPKYGQCVTGYAHPRDILTNSAAKAGDKLILTKPIGTGILTTAAGAELLTDKQVSETIAVMAMLNQKAFFAMTPLRPSACTDITGFGLLGHTCELAAGSGLTVVLDSSRIPILESVIDLARDGILPAGVYRNEQHFAESIDAYQAVPREVLDVLFDPQTSGGLLIAINAERERELVKRLG